MLLDLRTTTGLLAATIDRCTRQALACGALQPIETTQLTIPDGGIEFSVRCVSSLKRKAQDRNARIKGNTPDFNPFLPPEPELMVADVSDSHLAILNKFNVIDRHLLIVTRNFEDQERLLAYDDFAALWRCLQEFEGLGFYNGGKVAGASQRHKHLQLVPLPLAPGIESTPMERLWPKVAAPGELASLPTLPFRHRYTALPDGIESSIGEASHRCLQSYRSMLEQLGINAINRDHGEYQSAPYNLLLTRRWMLLTPRSRESWEGVSINSLGFAGSLFVPNPLDIEKVRQAGPMKMLNAVT